MELVELQQTIAATYGERAPCRGVPATVAWLAEELGELAEAVRKGSSRGPAARARRRPRLAGVAGRAARPLAGGRGGPLCVWLPPLRRLAVHLSLDLR